MDFNNKSLFFFQYYDFKFNELKKLEYLNKNINILSK
jgi:hypothetical protein